MEFGFPEDVQKFKAEVEEFVRAEWHPNPAWQSEGNEWTDYDKEFRRKLSKKGWLALFLPKEHGGAGLPILHQYVFHETMSYYGAPSGGLAINVVLPTLLRAGTEDQKKRYIPQIISGEIDFCLGYTEPNAGSDLASLEIRAVQDGDDFVVNGVKMFQSFAHRADYCWLAARTDPNVPKHKGISVFMADLRSPGITVKPLTTMGDARSNAVYWDDVRVPKENLIGEINRGWYYTATGLDYERVNVFPIGRLRASYERLVRHVKETTRNGKPLKDDPDVREKLARLSCDLETAQMLSLRALSVQMRGAVPNYEASAVKMFGTEMSQRMYYWATQMQGLYGSLVGGSKYAPLNGAMEKAHRATVIQTVGGGSSEIQRNIIAFRGLGLPR